ncbi:MAG: glycosyltransferase family 2 protein [Pseudolabrys sp.]
MNVLSRLESVGVKLCSDTAEISCNVFEPTPGFSPTPSALESQANPLVSCLMMTRGNIELMKYSLACYQRQTYANRELVIVAEPEAGEKVRTFIASQGAINVSVFVAPPGLTIGDHRNLGTARARGAILVCWDDDDLSDPRRLETSHDILRRSGAAAAFCSRLLVWWPQRKLAAISARRVWEGTIAAWRNYMPVYAPLARSEDSVAIDGLVKSQRVALFDCPLLYVRAVTGRNTWEADHFERFISIAECTFEGDQFDELNELLSDRVPSLEYAAVLNGKGDASPRVI